MNTARSFWFGWGALVVAGGGAYYYAKKEIDADRLAKHEAIQRRKKIQYQMQNQAQPRLGGDGGTGPASTPDPGSGGGTGQASTAGSGTGGVTSPYERSVPYKSPPGERLN